MHLGDRINPGTRLALSSFLILVAGPTKVHDVFMFTVMFTVQATRRLEKMDVLIRVGGH
jgi:hypothetical protein